jgi:F-type H+-transporting ATPase subunit delta
MTNTIENIYSSALFELLEDEHADKQAGYDAVLAELKAVGEVISSTELVKLTMLPTISSEEKLGVIKTAFGGKVSPYVLNFLCVLSDKKRLGHYGRIERSLRAKYYEKFGIQPVTVTGAFALTADQKAKLTAKMETITGKKVELNEKTDKSLIGGVVVDYGGSRIDGSVKMRLDSLKREIADMVM